MPKSLLTSTFVDVFTLASSLVSKARETMNMVTLRLDSVGLKSDVVLVVAPGDSPEMIAREMMDVLAS